ncbi:MAG: 50S ribosomal protein L22 [Planctomycetota bacterium]|jgi:large subunit ribosomal protein L22
MAAGKTFRAVHRFARIGPRKARLVAAMVRGLPVDDGMALLENHPRRAAYLLRKVLKSAMDNASQDIDVNLKALVISDARVDMGPLLGWRPRWRPRAMGRATPIRKRTSHLIIGLTEREGPRRRGGRPAMAQAETEEEAAAPAEE